MTMTAGTDDRPDAAALQREALRQRLLLRALLRRSADATVEGWSRESPPRTRDALAAYRGNAAAIATRALAAAFPTVQQLLGEESFDALAAALWHRHPPRRGDLALWGGELPAFVAADAQLASEPYLADVARLDWAVHAIEQAADAPSQPSGVERLASDDPATLALVLRDGAALIRSPHPIVSIWRAHRSDAADRFDAVRAAFAAGRGETAWVWRRGWRAQVDAVDAAQAVFTESLLAGRSIAVALDAAGASFGAEAWLRAALGGEWIAAVVDATNRSPTLHHPNQEPTS